MKTNTKFFLRTYALLLGWIMLSLGTVQAEFLSRPEVVGSPGLVSISFCEGSQFQIKFDIDQFTGTQTFTAQLSNASGSFASPIAIGTLSSANGQNKLMTCTIPLGTTAGNGYKVRVSATSGTVSQNPAEATITVVPFPAAANTNQGSYGLNSWKCFVYGYTDPNQTMTASVVAGINFFNTANYRGYFAINSLNFDNTWTNGMPGAVPTLVDTNNVCGSYKTSYALRLRRKHNFAAGNYAIEVGADDGIRVSVDGGATWLIDQFVERQFSTVIPVPSGCTGIALSGEVDLVIEYFQRFADSRLKVNIIGTSLTSPVFPTGFNGSSICTGGSTTLSATPAGGVYTIISGGTTAACISGNTFNPTACGAGTKTIRYTTGTGACAMFVDATVNVISAPSADFTGLTSTYCLGAAAVTLTPTVTGGTFSGPGVSGSTFNPTTAGAGVHQVTYQVSGNGCTVSSLQTVAVSANTPITFVPSSSSLCQNAAALTLTATPVGGVFSGAGVTGSISTGFSFNPATAAVGSNAIKYKTGTGSCADSVTQNITVVAVLSAPVITGVNTICSGSNTNLTAIPSNLTSYEWKRDGALLSNTTAVLQVSQAGIYTVSAVSSGCTTAVSDTFGVKVSSFNIVITGNPLVCSGGQLSLNSTLISGATYSWTGPNGFTANTNNFALSSMAQINAGTYTLVASKSGCASVTKTYAVTVLSLPTAPVISANNSPLCLGDTLRLGVTAVVGSTYEWEGPQLTLSTNPTVSVPDLLAGSYIYKVRRKVNDCYSLFTQVTIIVNSLPTPPTITSAAVACEGNSYTITTSAFASAYAWSGPNGFTAATKNALISNNMQAAQAGTYTLKITDSKGCKNTSTFVLDVKPKPNQPTIAPVAALCANDTLRMKVTNVQANVIYTWRLPNGTIIGADSAIKYFQFPLVSGTYTVTPSFAGCVGASISVPVVAKAIPAKPIVTNSTPRICEGEKITISADSIAGITYQWTGPNSFTSSKRVVSISASTVANAGDYQVVALNSSGCIGIPDTASVIILPSVSNLEITQSGVICENGTVILTAPSGYKTYKWSTGDTSRSTKTAKIGVYSVVVTNDLGCPSSGKKDVNRDECVPDIYVADAFTPNGDGYNDNFLIWGNGVTMFEIRVYNRWGENIFFGKSLNESWNGRFENKDCPAGDYAYVIDYEIEYKGKKETKRKTGSLNLIR